MSFQSTVQQFYGSDLVSSALGVGRYISVANSLIGGNILAILKKQKLIATAKATGYGYETSNYHPKDVYIGAIPVTTRTQETYRLRAEVAINALEDGSKVADHIILNPIIIETSFVVSNMEFAGPSAILSQFIDLYNSRNLSTLITEHQVLYDMALIEFDADNTAPDWGALECRCVFQQIKFYNFSRVQVSTNQLKDDAKGATTPSVQNTGVTATQSYTNAISAFSGVAYP